MYSPATMHMTAAADGADMDVYVPYLLEQLSHRHAGVSCFKTLVSLKCKDQFQILRFHTVIEKTVITYLLETGREYMHKEPAYEFFI